ncbi:unnamed protein product [Rhodiola kirilowii]
MHVGPPLSPTRRRPFGTPVGYPEFEFQSYSVPVQSDSTRGMSIRYPPTSAPPPNSDRELYSKVKNRIDCYFSDDNLIRDIYLRKNMDAHGWVPIELIARFMRVKELTSEIAIIKEAIQDSTVVEVKDEKVRRRNVWMTFLIPPLPL